MLTARTRRPASRNDRSDGLGGHESDESTEGSLAQGSHPPLARLFIRTSSRKFIRAGGQTANRG